MEFKGDVLCEGKTKIVHKYIKESSSTSSFVLIENKDRITAFNEKRADVIEGKAALSNDLNSMVFKVLQTAGMKTSFVEKIDDRHYLATQCSMIPIEWVSRRVATGSFLKRNPGVKEGYKFVPLKIETFLKDDANDDPQLSMEQILEAKMTAGNLVITQTEYDIMAKQTELIFEILEKAWATLDCTLVDMKIEFGVDKDTGEIILSDVIDNDSWRLWPQGCKEQMKDKQIYRDLEKVDESSLKKVKASYKWVVDKLEELDCTPKGQVVIVMGSPSDVEFARKIKENCEKLGLSTCLRVCSAHKATENVLKLISEHESHGEPVVYIAVAGRSNGLGPVISGNSTCPVINCPPLKDHERMMDVWSSLNVPSGLGCSTVLYPNAAACSCASIFSLTNFMVWAKLKVMKYFFWESLLLADRTFNQSSTAQ